MINIFYLLECISHYHTYHSISNKNILSVEIYKSLLTKLMIILI